MINLDFPHQKFNPNQGSNRRAQYIQTNRHGNIAPKTNEFLINGRNQRLLKANQQTNYRRNRIKHQFKMRESIRIRPHNNQRRIATQKGQ